MRLVTAADAKRHFSKILRDVRNGECVTVTWRGVEVAMIVPVETREPSHSERAKADLLVRLQSQKPVGATWTRDGLCERGRS